MRLGRAWWDLDEQGRLGIEVEHPPHDKHYLLTFWMPQDGQYGDLIPIADRLVKALNDLADEQQT